MRKYTFHFVLTCLFSVVLCTAALAVSDESIVDIDAFLDRLEAKGYCITKTAECIPKDIRLSDPPYFSMTRQQDGRYLVTTTVQDAYIALYPQSSDEYFLSPVENGLKYISEPYPDSVVPHSVDVQRIVSPCVDGVYERPVVREMFTWEYPSGELNLISKQSEDGSLHVDVSMVRGKTNGLNDEPFIEYSIYDSDTKESFSIFYDYLTNDAIRYYYYNDIPECFCSMCFDANGDVSFIYYATDPERCFQWSFDAQPFNAWYQSVNDPASPDQIFPEDFPQPSLDNFPLPARLLN